MDTPYVLDRIDPIISCVLCGLYSNKITTERVGQIQIWSFVLFMNIYEKIYKNMQFKNKNKIMLGSSSGLHGSFGSPIRRDFVVNCGVERQMFLHLYVAKKSSQTSGSRLSD